MSEIIAKVEHVSKKLCRDVNRGIKYTVSDIARDTFGLPLRGDTLRQSEFWAVNDVSFELKRGECLGLIGANGAGKSTLLKMMNGILKPDLGSIAIQGRVGALIEVGAGFHPLLSGIENIYVNGAILGMTKKEIDRKLDSIIEFSALNPEVLNAPVKTYSSGMYVRLGFAVAIHSEPDLLLIDEVLAVGDMAFIGKCHARIQELMKGGMTCILVSHSMTTIEAFCQKSILMAQGQVLEFGPSALATTRLREIMLSGEYVGQKMAENIKRAGIGITYVRVYDQDGRDMPQIPCGSFQTVEFAVKTKEPLRSGNVIIWIQRRVDRLMVASAYIRIGTDIEELDSGVYSVEIPFVPRPDEYWLGVTITQENQVERLAEVITPFFEITPTDYAREPIAGDTRHGLCIMPLEFVPHVSHKSFEEAAPALDLVR